MMRTGRTGEVLRQVRLEHGLQQWQAGGLAGRSRNWVTETENGRMEPDPAALAQIGHKLKDGRLVQEAARRVTGGAYVGPTLDGDCADLHWTAVAAKVVEELEEALPPARRILAMVLKPARTWSHAVRQELDMLMMQLIDVERGVQYLVTVVGRMLGINPAYWYQMHDAKLAERGYTREALT